jgi:hypothetical protein
MSQILKGGGSASSIRFRHATAARLAGARAPQTESMDHFHVAWPDRLSLTSQPWPRRVS